MIRGAGLRNMRELFSIRLDDAARIADVDPVRLDLIEKGAAAKPAEINAIWDALIEHVRREHERSDRPRNDPSRRGRR